MRRTKMKNKKAAYTVQAAVGMALLLTGLLVCSKEEMWAQFGICIGFGTALSVLGISNLIYGLRLPPGEREKIGKQKKIEVNDERNVRIRERTGNMVAKIMTYVLCAFILILALAGADKTAVLMAVGLLAIQFALFIACSNYYFKKM